MASTRQPNINDFLSQLPKRFQPYGQEAVSEANVRFGAERSGLLALLAAAQDTYQKSVAQARSAAQIIGAATQQAQGQLSDPSNPITGLALKAQGMPGTEGAIVAQNLGLTANATRSLLAQQGVNAASAQRYQSQQALGQFRSDVGKVQGQQQDLASRYGDYLTGRYDSLVGADRKQRHDANQAARDLSARFALAGVDQGTGKVVPGGPGDPTLSPSAQKSAADLQFFKQHGYYPPTGPPKNSKPGGGNWLTPEQHNKARDSIDYALSEAKSIRQHAKGLSRQQIAQTLVQGKPSFSTTVNGTRTTIPGIKATSALYARTALDMLYLGYVSAGTKRALNRAGLRIDELGYKQPPRKVAPKYIPPGNYAAGPVGA
jgi:hypothetical protein